MPDLTVEQEACNYHTFRHIERVRNLLNSCSVELMKRGQTHDQSKLESPEVELFTELTPKLAEATYGSDEYNEFLEQLKPALDHHYANNRHHPQHWPENDSTEANMLEEHIEELKRAEEPNEDLIASLEKQVASLRSSVSSMNLIDIMEMLCDWKASSERQNDGNIRKSIKDNVERFGMSTQLGKIMENTADLLFG